MKKLFFVSLLLLYPIATTLAQSCVGTANLVVTIVPPPAIPTITVNGEYLSSSSPIGNQWLLNGTPIAGATEQSFNPTQAGNYSVEVNIDGCTATSDPLFSTAAGNVQLHQGVVLHPNPTKFATTICSVAATRSETIMVTLYDSAAKLMYQNTWTLQAGNNDLVLPTQQLTNGIYYVQLQAAQWYNVQKLVKQ